MNKQMELEEQALEQDLAEGRITQKEFNRQLNDLYRDFQAAVEEQAEEAYRDVMSSHGYY